MEIIKLMRNLKITIMFIFLSYTHEFVMVPMRDLVRTPYGRTDVGFYITDVKGYALVIQSLRGFQGSEGEPSVFRTDGWGELWSLGSVCGAWFSAMGITQYL